MDLEYLSKLFWFAITLYYTVDYIFISEIDNITGFLSLFVLIILISFIFIIVNREKILKL